MFKGMMVIGMSLAGSLNDVSSLFAVFTVSGTLFILGAMLLIPLISTGNAGNDSVQSLQTRIAQECISQKKPQAH
jgi:hypothetical protein